MIYEYKRQSSAEKNTLTSQLLSNGISKITSQKIADLCEVYVTSYSLKYISDVICVANQETTLLFSKRGKLISVTKTN
jgi:hypothetical protein